MAPESRKSPASESSSKSTATVSANGPNAVISRRCSRIRTSRPRTPACRRRQSAQHASIARNSSAVSSSPGGVPRMSVMKSRAMSWSVRTVLDARGASPVTGSAASKLSSNVCGNRRRSRSIAWAGRTRSVRIASTHAPSCCRVRRIAAAAPPTTPAAGRAGAGPGRRRTRRAPDPRPPSSTSHEPLRWPASENE